MAEQKNEDGAETILLGALRNLLCELRSTNKYGECLNDLISKFELTQEISHATAEALIILAADCLDNPLERDAALAALGLVRGCSRLEQPMHLTAKNAVSWRRIQFLLKSTYPLEEDEYYQCEAALDNIKSGKVMRLGLY